MAGGQKTFVALTVLAAADVNAYLMDQSIMRVTSGARPTAAAQGGGLLAGMTLFQTDTLTLVHYTGTAWCEVTPYSAKVNTQENTTSTTYTDLTTAGPSVTVTTGTKALVMLGAYLFNAANLQVSYMAPVVSGATTISAATNESNGIVVQWLATGTNIGQASCFGTFLLTGLTAGANTFKAQYRTTSTGTCYATFRNITVVGVPG